MPYIKDEDRPRFDVFVDNLVCELEAFHKKYGYDGAFAGGLNYVVTTLTTKLLKRLFGKLRYWQIAIVIGVFKNIADEFYRRAAAPYEDVQIKNNGDVY